MCLKVFCAVEMLKCFKVIYAVEVHQNLCAAEVLRCFKVLYAAELLGCFKVLLTPNV